MDSRVGKSTSSTLIDFEKLDERPAALCVLSQLSACREEDLGFLQVAVSCEDAEDFQVAWYLRESLSTGAS